MSYILDALRRAEAERERGEVPSLHAQQFPTFSSEGDEPGRSRLLIGAVVVLALALAAALAWNFFASDPPPPVVQAVTPAPPAAVAPPLVATAPAVVAAAPTLPSPATAADGRAPAAAGTATRPGAASMAAATPAERRAAATPGRTSSVAEARRARRAEPATAPTPTTSAAKGSTDTRVYAFAELPEAIRREMPKLAFGGASYSRDAASRMVILNGQVFHEGDNVAAGVVLHQIKLKGAILSYKGYRYELGY